MAGEAQAETGSPRGQFAWGAEAGTGIDMGGDDMTTFNLHASFGYRNDWIRFAGIGAGIDVMLSNSTRSFPIYAMARTSFSNKPKLLFGDLRVGIAYNQTDGVPDRANLYPARHWHRAGQRQIFQFISPVGLYLQLYDILWRQG